MDEIVKVCSPCHAHTYLRPAFTYGFRSFILLFFPSSLAPSPLPFLQLRTSATSPTHMTQMNTPRIHRLLLLLSLSTLSAVTSFHPASAPLPAHRFAARRLHSAVLPTTEVPQFGAPELPSSPPDLSGSAVGGKPEPPSLAELRRMIPKSAFEVSTSRSLGFLAFDAAGIIAGFSSILALLHSDFFHALPVFLQLPALVPLQLFTGSFMWFMVRREKKGGCLQLKISLSVIRFPIAFLPFHLCLLILLLTFTYLSQPSSPTRSGASVMTRGTERFQLTRPPAPSLARSRTPSSASLPTIPGSSLTCSTT